MSEEKQAVDTPATEAPVKRKRGRPPGSKNKVKKVDKEPVKVEAAEVKEDAPVVVIVPKAEKVEETVTVEGE